VSFTGVCPIGPPTSPDPVPPWTRAAGWDCHCGRPAHYWRHDGNAHLFSCDVCARAKGVYGPGYAKFSRARGLEARLLPRAVSSGAS
jgi:hypothetical protein